MLATLFLMHPRIQLAFFATRTLLSHGQLVIHQHSQIPLCSAALQQVSPSLYWCMLDEKFFAGGALKLGVAE